MFASEPWPQGDRLDRLEGDLALGACPGQGLEVLGVVGLAHGHDVVRQQDRVKVKSREGATVAGRDLDAVAGDADEFHQSLVTCLDGGLDRAARAEGGVPLDWIGKAVQLPQVDMIDAEALQGAVQLLARGIRLSLPGFGSKKETARLALQPGGDPQLRIAVAGRGINVVDAVLQKHVERAIGS